MNMPRGSVILLLSLTLGLPLLGGCQPASQPSASTQPATPATSAGQPQTALGRVVDNGVRQARAELEKSNIDLDDGPHIRIGRDHHEVNHKSNLPKAQITPQGDLVIEGKDVAVTPAQRAMLLAYRQQIIDIAEAGMSMGVQGADLAGKAVSEVLGSVFSGKGYEFGKRMEAEGRKLEAQGRQLCTRLEPLHAMQQQLAASLPEFKPYATMDAGTVDDCMKEGSSVTTR